MAVQRILILFSVLLIASTYANDECALSCAVCEMGECKECIENAEEPFGNSCRCKDDYDGDDCSIYTGDCDDRCYGCYGEGNGQCEYCSDHASRNFHGECECDPNWSGYGCTTYLGGDYSNPDECNPKCAGGCTGPTAMDCVRCVEHAHLDPFGECVCDANFGGIDCCSPTGSMHCDPRCYGGCNGITNFDCVACVANAHLNSYGACVCEPLWGGDDCSDYLSYSECHPICDPEFGCHGLGVDDCAQCTANAHKDWHGYCCCDAGWAGNDCSTWMGECDPKCLSTCSGPGAGHCHDCVYHSIRNDEMECECEEDYGGESCEIYIGACESICYGCSGPSTHDCDYCVDHATKDQYGICQCDRQWHGTSCTDFIYQGLCDPICQGCNGPNADNCVDCVEHAFTDMYGFCVCEHYWSGRDCGTYVYTGRCHVKCNGDCVGPNATDCVDCVPNAYRNENGECICEDSWTGEDCQLKNYVGRCNDLCDGRHSCFGPSAEDCQYCVPNATRDAYGACECLPGYYDSDCSQYSFDMCHSYCDESGCTGPKACDCNGCVANAFLNNSGYCECAKHWGGHDCTEYIAICHPICDGCYGPAACDCTECVEHSHLANDTCVCDENWSEEDCSLYIGECHHLCEKDHCHGPESCDCDYCREHAHFDERNYCVCDDDYEGMYCENYVSTCHPICDTCSGPEACDCLTCSEHADFHSNGICSCDEHWDGLDCSHWVGPCDIRCNRCTGPDPCDCIECVANAEKDQDGLCTCQDKWTGYSCTEYVGGCDAKCIGCHGPDALDCDFCVRNAYRNAFGACQCHDEWRDEDCSIYSGMCDIKCVNGCFGPLDSDCIDCIRHSERDATTNRCMCKQWWTGDDCSHYMGVCGDTCIGCNGPMTAEDPHDVGICKDCVANSHRKGQDCVCDSDWSGAKDCSVYVGPCYKNCAAYVDDMHGGCFGPSEYECNECVAHSWRNEDGICTCDPDWGDGATACSSYTGHCDYKCKGGCHGPTSKDCVECAGHSYSVSDAAGNFDCVCEHNWGGSDCSHYYGRCSDKCRGCYGPHASQCIECVENAERGHHGSCECQREWDGDYCMTFVACDPICAMDPMSHEEFTCKGPGKGNCMACVTNAHRNYLGECECDEGWGGVDCYIYEGVCSSLCAYDCHGPTAFDCVNCVENAIRDVDNDCICSEWWVGDDCSIYRGQCDSHCNGCLGPDPNHCIDCVANAYYEADGSCICRDQWVGSGCSQSKQDCHETCMICNYPETNECITCAPGYTLVNGYCVPCDKSCETCGPDNSTTEKDCLSCHPTFGMPGDGLSHCEECDPTCLYCDFTFADSCTACHLDSTLKRSSSGGHFCQCDFPKVRREDSLTCENECPTGYSIDIDTRICSITEVHQIYVDLNFETNLPVFNTAEFTMHDESASNIHADSCNPPKALGHNRGSYFSGKGHQEFIEIHNLVITNSHNVKMWVKAELGDSTLAFFKVDTFGGWSEYKNKEFDQKWDFAAENVHYNENLDFWLTSCNTAVLDLGGQRVVSKNVPAGWVNLGYTIISELAGSDVAIYVDSQNVSGSIISETIYKAHMTEKSLLGSYNGVAYEFHGFIYDFVYSDRHVSPEGRNFNENSHLINCDWDEYLDPESECEQCHHTCTSGCTNGDVCLECHSDCRTCVGPADDQCVDCHCHASRVNPYDSSSCCACDHNDYGDSADDCRVEECGSNCEACAEQKCLWCEYGYHLSEGGHCEACNPRDCTHCDKHLPTCVSQGARPETGTCNCG